jgi:soluble lytic murein transglycosylase-like protein
MLKKYEGNETLALFAYNAGPRKVKERKGKPFKVTKKYIKKIIKKRRELKS